MKMQTLILILVILVPVCAILYSCTYNETNNYYNYYGVVKLDGTPEDNEFVRLVNEHRISIGLPVLIHEVLASDVCYKRNLKEIESNVAPSHLFWEKMVRDAQVNENNGSHICAENYISPYELLHAYLNSTSHKLAIENPIMTHIGTSIINRQNHTLIVKYN